MPRTDELAWRPTAAHLRACIAAVVFALAGVLLGRPDVLVLATPFAVIAAWSIVRRPTIPMSASATLSHATIREGEATRWSVHLSSTEGVDTVVARLATGDRWQLAPETGIVVVQPEPDARVPLTVSVDVRSVQWGRRVIGPGLFAANSAWGAFRVGPAPFEPLTLTTLPLPPIFDSAAPVPSPAGLVGLHRSRRRGDGTEFAAIRPFAVGDRLRRIHWPVSLRMGTLHVTATHADSDTNVLLVVDASTDAGTSGGVDGSASSLDRAVRGAGAIAAHFLRHGDGVALRTFGATTAARVPAATGTLHLRRLLNELAMIEPGSVGVRRSNRSAELAHLGLVTGGLVIVLSPLLSELAMEEAVSLTRLGSTVLVVDTFPDEVPSEPDDPSLAVAWRLRLLERASDIRRLQEAGVPVVPWRGPGTVDQLLRDLGRRAGAPRIVRR